MSGPKDRLGVCMCIMGDPQGLFVHFPNVTILNESPFSVSVSLMGLLRTSGKAQALAPATLKTDIALFG